MDGLLFKLFHLIQKNKLSPIKAHCVNRVIASRAGSEFNIHRTNHIIASSLTSVAASIAMPLFIILYATSGDRPPAGC